MNEFKLKAPYKPTGDQPQAIAELVKGFKEGNQCQTLLGVTGSGKTFTMANVIQQLQKPTLVIAHNKTLAAQLYGEFKEMFPENAVEYFVSRTGMKCYGQLIDIQYDRNDMDFHRGTFRVTGRCMEIIPADRGDTAIRVENFRR